MLNSSDINYLKDHFKKLDIEYLYAKDYSEKCPFDFLINHVLTVLIVSNELDIDKIQLAIDERAIALNELIGCIMFKDTSNIDNSNDYYIILTKDIKQDLKKLFTNIKTNKNKYVEYLNNYNGFIGLNNMRVRKLYRGIHAIDSDTLLKILQDKINSLGRNPKANELRKPSFQLYYKSFGSLNNALEVLGHIPTRYRVSDKKQEEKRLIRTLKAKCKELGRSPTSLEVDGANTMMVYWGSWKQVLIRAGVIKLKTFSRRDKLLDEYIEVFNLAIKNDITPKMLEAMIELRITIAERKLL